MSSPFLSLYEDNIGCVYFSAGSHSDILKLLLMFLFRNSPDLVRLHPRVLRKGAALTKKNGGLLGTAGGCDRQVSADGD